MKRTLLITALLRIALTTMLTSNLTLKLAAHDLPQDAKSFAIARANVARFASSSRDRAILSSGKSSRAESLRAQHHDATPLVTTGFGACSIADWNTAPNTEDILVTAIAPGLRLNRFDASSNYRFDRKFEEPRVSKQTEFYAKAGGKTRTPNPTHATSRLIEEYRPYDLSVRDWRFAPSRFEQRTSASQRNSHPVAEMHVPALTRRNKASLERFAAIINASVKAIDRNSQRFAIAAGESLLNDFRQAVVSTRLLRPQYVLALVTASRSPLRTGASLGLQHINLAWGAEPNRSPASTRPYFTTPPFVYFENAEGLRLVLTREAAFDRGLILHQEPASLKKARVSQTVLQKIAGSVVKQSMARLNNWTASLDYIGRGAKHLWLGYERQQSTRIAREPTLIQ
ncbi:MAG: hypothetical protein AB8B50_09060 [Pirellulaceae bacterium]